MKVEKNLLTMLLHILILFINIYLKIGSEKNVFVNDKWTSLCQYGKYIKYTMSVVILW